MTSGFQKDFKVPTQSEGGLVDANAAVGDLALLSFTSSFEWIALIASAIVLTL